jgi:hypothetical protein
MIKKNINPNDTIIELENLKKIAANSSTNRAATRLIYNAEITANL